ncbi:response regulator [Massilia sp. TS11]|uniref:response regulator n=1 Tax=Massilia sp. TS11 TaxID=2908003 RepID=UPI001EDABD98|nr:response regulator [Massilia sp. TS11]MCG2585407.1 response regulator [Massilia sp. TS11]
MKIAYPALRCLISAASATCATPVQRPPGPHAPRRRPRRAAAPLLMVPQALDAFAHIEGGIGEQARRALDGELATGMPAATVRKALANLETALADLTRLRDQVRDSVLPALAPAAASQAAAERARVAQRAAELAVPRVLHVDSDEDGAATLAALLSTDARVTHVGTLAEARTLLRHQHFELLVLDPELSDGDGAELLPELGSTALLVHARQHAAWHSCADGFLIKPWSSQRQIWQTVARMLGIEIEAETETETEAF